MFCAGAGSELRPVRQTWTAASAVVATNRSLENKQLTKRVSQQKLHPAKLVESGEDVIFLFFFLTK